MSNDNCNRKAVKIFILNRPIKLLWIGTEWAVAAKLVKGAVSTLRVLLVPLIRGTGLETSSQPWNVNGSYSYIKAGAIDICGP